MLPLLTPSDQFALLTFTLAIALALYGIGFAVHSLAVALHHRKIVRQRLAEIKRTHRQN